MADKIDYTKLALAVKKIASLKRPLLADELDALFANGTQVLINSFLNLQNTIDEIKQGKGVPNSTEVLQTIENAKTAYNENIKSSLMDLAKSETDLQNMQKTVNTTLSDISNASTLIEQAKKILGES